MGFLLYLIKIRTIIFNENWNQHGKDEYDESEDVLRFDVTPKISKK